MRMHRAAILESMLSVNSAPLIMAETHSREDEWKEYGGSGQMEHLAGIASLNAFIFSVPLTDFG